MLQPLKPSFRHPLAGILAILAAASPAHARTDTRLPVISRVEVKYSIVSHYSHLGDRVAFYNQYGQPQGNTNYAVPHLVYEPVVTLYNPYNTTLTLPKCRVRIANPPVGFKFRKNNDYLRDEWNNGGPFLGLGRFQHGNESNPDVQKTITLLLRTSSNSSTAPDGSIVLQPGQSMSFATWVESGWTWGLETSGGVNGARSFFDSIPANDRSNKDGRTNNLFGVEAKQGGGQFFIYHDYRAGFQTDALSVPTGRPAATRYSFETGTFGTTSWVAMKLTDTLNVQAKGVDTVLDPLIPDFGLSLMAGDVQDPVADTLKSYSFNIGDLEQPETETPQAPAISRILYMRDIVQSPPDPTPGGKTSFASFLMIAKSTALQQKKFQAESQPPANELYETKLQPLFDWTDDGWPYNGPSDHPQGGVVVTGVERVGDNLMLDVAAEPFRTPALWKVMGGGDPAALTNDHTGSTVIQEGPSGTGIYKLTVPIPSGVEKYFVRLAL